MTRGSLVSCSSALVKVSGKTADISVAFACVYACGGGVV